MFEEKYKVVARLSQDQSGDLATRVEEAVHGVRVLKSFGRGAFAAGQFASQATELRSTELRKARAVANIWLYLILIPEIAIGFSMLAGIWLVAEDQLSVGSLVAFFATAMVLRWPTESLGFLLGFTLEAKTAAERFFEVMDSENKIVDPAQSKKIQNPKGLLEFHDVHFRYPDTPAEVGDLLKGVNLRIEPGESVALIGLTGCGKTTLTALTTRLYDVTGGSITIDGVDVRDLTRQELRSLIAMAFEDATLFSSSVKDNVLLGNPGATEEDLKQAIEIAQAQFAYDLPNGMVEDALRHVLKETTALIVAHRPSTVMLADRVALLEDGRITAFGTHQELLKSSEHYRYVITSLDIEQKEREVNL